MFQEVIGDITEKMGSGMCVFLEDTVGSMTQWDEVKGRGLIISLYLNKSMMALCGT